ncbi:MAG: hypothetical protein ABGY95_08325 [Rubritalea sp.]|uniref:hypothetical protein n=1 Tax=Rubritalea sp. TaxID=2109375 RepID=UPI0032421DFD
MKPKSHRLREAERGAVNPLPSFNANKSWKNYTTDNSLSIECKFIIEQKTGKLSSTPFVKKSEHYLDRPVHLTTIILEQ